MTPFIVVTKQRSGSGFLESCLNSHPEISCFYEFLLYNKSKSDCESSRFGFYDYWLDKIRENEKFIRASYSDEVHKELFNGYLNDIFLARPNSVIGGDIKYGQESQYMWGLLASRGFKIIQLIRCNLLKCYVSIILNGMQKKTGRKAHEFRKVPIYKIKVPVENLLYELQMMFDQILFYCNVLTKEFGEWRLPLFYENLFSESSRSGSTISLSSSEEIYNFLEVKDRKVSMVSTMKKLNPTSLENYVINYDELLEIITPTKWSFLLADKRCELLDGWNHLWNVSLDKTVKEFEGKNFSNFKENLSQVLVEKINPISKEIKKLIDNKEFLDKILLDGHKKANDIAAKKVKKMQEIIGF